MTSNGRPVKILRVIARLNMGGPALHVAYLSEGLRERGYETTLVAGTLARGEDSMSFVAEGRGVRIERVSELSREISPLRDVRAICRLARLMRRERPQILHTHTAKAGAVGRLAALIAGDARPPIIVHTFHGHVLRGYFGPLSTALFRELERRLAGVANVLVAVSPEVRDDLVALGVAPREKFVVIRLGIELDRRVDPGLDGVPDVVRDGEDGFLVEPGDVEQLADRLARLAREPELREQMGVSGRERVLSRYAVERLIDDVDALYRDLLATHGPGSDRG